MKSLQSAWDWRITCLVMRISSLGDERGVVNQTGSPFASAGMTSRAKNRPRTTLYGAGRDGRRVGDSYLTQLRSPLELCSVLNPLAMAAAAFERQKPLPLSSASSAGGAVEGLKNRLLVAATASRFATAGRLITTSRFAARIAAARAAVALDPADQLLERTEPRLAARIAARVADWLSAAGGFRRAAGGLRSAASRLGGTAGRFAAGGLATRAAAATAPHAVEQPEGVGVAGIGPEHHGHSRDNWENQSRFHEHDPYKGETRWRLCDTSNNYWCYRRVSACRLNTPSCFRLRHFFRPSRGNGP